MLVLTLEGGLIIENFVGKLHFKNFVALLGMMHCLKGDDEYWHRTLLDHYSLVVRGTTDIRGHRNWIGWEWA